MKELKLWQFIADQLEKKNPVVFMCVLESEGSSPGRQGFKMAVTYTEIYGSIGGGIMEHKLVELAKEKLKVFPDKALTKKQIHQKSAPGNQSGMICSGEQTIFIYKIQEKDTKHIYSILNTLQQTKNGLLEINSDGICFYEKLIPEQNYRFEKKSEIIWEYEEKLGYKNFLYIIGGGHCSFALSEVMSRLDFFIHVIDERKNLNTMRQNTFANRLEEVKNFDEMDKLIPSGSMIYLVVMTHGYRTDAAVLRKLIDKKFCYLGVLGSKSKIKKLQDELLLDGISSELISQLHAPIGLDIKSETPEEIAISIAAEIIKIKNAQR
ncbi:MAG TPA: XdhC family protein [Bacteroidia bacterium]|nr:XdhC family protein [Bacteroidia bacterium]